MDLEEHQAWWSERGAQELRDLLYREWDPIGLKNLADAPDDEYDAYAGQLVRRLRAGADEEEIAFMLESFRREDMGLEPEDPPLETARRIREWYRSSRSSGS